MVFERFTQPKTPEQQEQRIRKILSSHLSTFVNAPTMRMAFEAAREENKKKDYGMTNNQILNLLRSVAKGEMTAMDHEIYGSYDETVSHINAEIDNLREGLTDDEKRT